MLPKTYLLSGSDSAVEYSLESTEYRRSRLTVRWKNCTVYIIAPPFHLHDGTQNCKQKQNSAVWSNTFKTEGLSNEARLTEVYRSRVRRNKHRQEDVTRMTSKVKVDLKEKCLRMAASLRKIGTTIQAC